MPYADELTRYRQEKDEFFTDVAGSPIPEEDQERFTGLAYYPPDEDWIHEVPVADADGSAVTIATSDGREQTFRRSRTVRLVIGDRTVELTLLTASDTDDVYFLPFRDATSGNETYGAGRYLEVELEDEDGMVEIDFNLAYNPYCAYDTSYSCPLPPPENWLDVPIRAGEKDYPLH